MNQNEWKNLKKRIHELINDNELPEAFELLRKYKDSFKGYEVYRDRYMHDYVQWKPSEQNDFKKTLHTFIDKDVEDRRSSLPPFKQIPNFVWIVGGFIIIFVGGSISVLNNNQFGCVSSNTTINNNNSKTINDNSKKIINNDSKQLAIDTVKPKQNETIPPKLTMLKETISVAYLAQASNPIKQGDNIVIRASGSIKVGEFVGNSSPRGREAGLIGFPLEDYNIFKQFNHAALLYRVKASGSEAWDMAGEYIEFTATQAGVLEFLVNDNFTQDNAGAYRVQISIERK